MARKKLSAVLIGAGGNMRGAHVPRIRRDGSVTVVGIADPIEGAAHATMQRLGYETPYFSNWRTMLKRISSDTVLISTPHKDHFGQAKASLLDGRHVLIEKPLVVKPTHAKELLQLAKQSNRYLVVAYQRHWMREYAYARELVNSGQLGEIRGVMAYVTQNWTNIGGWRLDPDLSGGGMFMDTGSHLVASTLWVTGLHPKSVSATLDNANAPIDINLALHVAFENGAVGTLAAIGNASRHDERLAIAGERASLVLHLHQWGVRSMLLNDEPVEIPKRVRPDSPDEAFFRAIRSGGKHYEAADFALEVSRLTDAAYRSVTRKAPVRVAR